MFSLIQLLTERFRPAVWFGGAVWLAAATGHTPRLMAAELVYPLTAAATAQGDVYISDLRLPGVWKIEQQTGTVLFQASKKFRTPLNTVRCVRLDSKSRVLAGDSATREVYRLDDQGTPQGLTQGRIGIPMDLAETAEGDLLVSDLETHRIWKIPSKGGEPAVYAAIPAPRGLCLDAEQRLWVVSHGKDQVVRVLPDGRVETVVSGRPFQFPHEILVHGDGTALVSDGYARTIWKIPPGAAPERWIEGEPLKNPVGLCRLGENILIVDPRAKSVFQASQDGKLSMYWDGAGK